MQAVLITGAARGIGRAIAEKFAQRGWFVGLFDIDAAACEQLAASEHFPSACAGYCDVTDRESVAHALERFAEASGGRLDVLVNNAGVLTASALSDQSPEQIDSMIAVNVRGLTQVAQLAFPLLRDTPGSTMLNLCSASSIHGIPLLAVYSASKFYVDGLTQALAIEWAEHDIHVTSLKPPAISTSMGHALHEKHKARMPINMDADAVAEAAVNAVRRRRPHHILGVGPKIWYVLDRLLPASMGRRLTQLLIPL